MAEDEKKLQVDDDWKSQAAAEKEQLAQAVEKEQPAAALPQAGFPAIVQWLAMQAMLGLGGMKGPGGQDIPPNLEVAKHYIDLLDVLDAKTAGNLDQEEKRLLDTTLHQLRMAYVEMVRNTAPPTPAG